MEVLLKRAGSYVRVSTYQESQEKSITDQVRMLNEIIDKDETLVNVGTYIDQGVTGQIPDQAKTIPCSYERLHGRQNRCRLLQTDEPFRKECTRNDAGD